MRSVYRIQQHLLTRFSDCSFLHTFRGEQRKFASVSLFGFEDPTICATCIYRRESFVFYPRLLLSEKSISFIVVPATLLRCCQSRSVLEEAAVDLSQLFALAQNTRGTIQTSFTDKVTVFVVQYQRPASRLLHSHESTAPGPRTSTNA